MLTVYLEAEEPFEMETQDLDTQKKLTPLTFDVDFELKPSVTFLWCVHSIQGKS